MRCGGPKAREDPGHQLVTPKLLELRGTHFSIKLLQALRAKGTVRHLDEVDPEAVMSKLADSTHRSYATGWKQWCLFLAGTAQSPYLQGESRAEKLCDEKLLVRLLVFLHQHFSATAGGGRTIEIHRYTDPPFPCTDTPIHRPRGAP